MKDFWYNVVFYLIMLTVAPGCTVRFVASAGQLARLTVEAFKIGYDSPINVEKLKKTISGE